MKAMNLARVGSLEKSAIVALRPDWHSDELDKGRIKVVYSGSATDVPPVSDHVRRDSQNATIKERLKDVDDVLEIVIVKDMMLTGYDSPPLHTLYLDRPLKGALLMQTLARVNRTFRGKQDGLLVAYAPLDADKPEVQLLPIPQLVAAGTVEARISLPSFAWLPPAGQAGDKSFALPWKQRTADCIVGELARRQSAESPDRTISSAKSWLCHSKVDRHQPILPWNAPEGVEKLSPVVVSQRFLEHLIAAWQHAFPEAPIAEQQVVLTVPAHQWMWSAHDVVNHHKRRYSKRSLRALIKASPLRLERIGYLNSLLFPVAVAERLVSKLRRKDEADLSLPPAPLNSALERVFAAERHLVGRLPLPPGLSLFAVASAT